MGTAYLPLAPGETTVQDSSGNITIFDPNGNPISTVNPTYTWDTSPTTISTPVDSGGGTDISTIGTFFGQLAAGVAGIVRATSGAQAPICPTTLPCAAPNRPGYVYNPTTGQYLPAQYSQFTSGNSLIFILIILGAVLLLRR